MSDKVQSLLNDIGKLSSTELKEVNDKLSVLKSLKPSKNDEDRNNTDLSLFYDTIISKLHAEIGYRKQPLDSFRKKDGYKKLKDAFEFVNDFIETALKAKPNRREKQKGYMLFAKLLVKDEKNHPGVPLSLKLILNNYENFPGLVDRSYPGYLAHGCGRFIFTDVQNPKDLDKFIW